jgi:hypothetical protein
VNIPYELLHFIDGLLVCDRFILVGVEELIAPHRHVTHPMREQIRVAIDNAVDVVRRERSTATGRDVREIRNGNIDEW